jgi:hypothetical protein
MDRDDRERAESPSGAMHAGQAAGTAGVPTPRTDAADTGVDGGADTGTAAGARHEAGGAGDGMRTGGSAGTASGHDPMPDEVRRQAEPPSRAREKGDGAGTV